MLTPFEVEASMYGNRGSLRFFDNVCSPREMDNAATFLSGLTGLLLRGSLRFICLRHTFLLDPHYRLFRASLMPCLEFKASIEVVQVRMCANNHILS